MNDYITNAFTRQNDKTNLEVNNLNVDCITSTNNNFELDSDGNLSVKSITAEQGLSGGNSLTEIMNAIYPVGAIYMSVSSTNPSVIFGGTWEQIQDRFLLACGSSFLNGQTGGSVEHNHITGDCTLTIDQIPSHKHNNPCAVVYGGNAGIHRSLFATDSDFWNMDDPNNPTSLSGGGQSHNHGNTGNSGNLPPYLAVYTWKRIQ